MSTPRPRESLIHHPSALFPIRAAHVRQLSLALDNSHFVTLLAAWNSLALKSVSVFTTKRIEKFIIAQRGLASTDSGFFYVRILWSDWNQFIPNEASSRTFINGISRRVWSRFGKTNNDFRWRNFTLSQFDLKRLWNQKVRSRRHFLPANLLIVIHSGAK